MHRPRPSPSPDAAIIVQPGTRYQHQPIRLVDRSTALVSHSLHEFTIDFIRLDYTTRNPTEGVMVQRVNMSPLLANQPIEALIETLDDYAATMPDGMDIQEDH